MSAWSGRTIIFLFVLTATLWPGGVIECPSLLCPESLLFAADTAETGSKKSPEKSKRSSKKRIADLNALMIDFAGYNICDRLKGQYIPLSSRGTSSGEKKTNTGVIRIDTCNTRETDPGHLMLEISGIGWQWVSRKKEQLGATFAVDDNIKFGVKISMLGAFDMAYAQEKHILTLWFVPTRPVDANLKVMGGVDVDTESLWSSIVGVAGSMTGQTPEQRAETAISAQGDRLVRSRLSQGMTLIIDLCTSRHYFKLGTFPAGEIPESSGTGRKYLVNSKGILHEGSVLMAGPFDTEKPVIASLNADQGRIKVSLICEDDAKKTSDAFLNGRILSDVRPLAEDTVQPGRPVTMKVKAKAGCKVVLFMRPSDPLKGVSLFDYSAYHEGAKAKPLVDCNK